jgi:hypothetical protein
LAERLSYPWVLPLFLEQLQVEVDEVKVGLWSGVVAPPELGEEAIRGVADRGVDGHTPGEDGGGRREEGGGRREEGGGRREESGERRRE